MAGEPIGSPVVDRADAVVALNPPSMAKFEAAVAPGGLLVVNTSLIEALPSRSDIEIVAVPCTALARTAGDDRLVSVVALGALLARRPLVPLSAARDAIAAVVQAKRPGDPRGGPRRARGRLRGGPEAGGDAGLRPAWRRPDRDGGREAALCPGPRVLMTILRREALLSSRDDRRRHTSEAAGSRRGHGSAFV